MAVSGELSPGLSIVENRTLSRFTRFEVEVRPASSQTPARKAH
jgi:hypothetical protein